MSQSYTAHSHISSARRDFLRELERSVQKEWEEAKVFEVDAPEDKTIPKYMATFPYPYMNGRLHLGHTFTLLKADFITSYQRLRGKRALYPFGFHCTGMPIKACADKLKREIAEFGCPPVFPIKPKQKEKTEAPVQIDLLEFHSKKQKTKQKTTETVPQWNIMQDMGVPVSEIPNFTNAEHWVDYFPPHCKNDLKAMGVGVDWRRSFITTDKNPYYDSFVRWQFETLRDMGKIQFGKRYVIWSPLDNQPCMDHDRSKGEKVLPQKYTLIKLEVSQPFPDSLKSLEGFKVFLVPATLRPETMYGQTNCWVHPEAEYAATRINETDVFICAAHAARNMSFQELSRVDGAPEILLTVTGQDLIGTLVNAPLSVYKQVYVLPMLSIDYEMGTGVVTSVPSDAPDDYTALKQAQTDEKFCEQFKVKPEWTKFEPVPVINVPGYGDMIAPAAIAEDPEKAKNIAYLKGFNEGVMLVGEYKGIKVKEAKPIIKNLLIQQGLAVQYCEPQSDVISRSGDKCVVALKDQWYITYGEEEWRTQTEALLEKMDTYGQQTKQTFQATLKWLKEWACSRTYGLGTRIPWSPEYLIESLSDSTVYMAFYTVAHLLQGGVIDGSQVGPANIRPEQLTREVWDYILRNGNFPDSTTIPRETLDRLKSEFDYWYPVDIRISGKELIQNHLTFYMYTHCALFPPEKWPKAVKVNGHIKHKGKKMAKSEGNFLTSADAIEIFTVDGMRLGLAVAGDTTEYANFGAQTAETAIIRFTTQYTWIEKVLAAVSSFRTGPITRFEDRVFESRINNAIEETERFYDQALFCEAMRTGFFELQTARDNYRNVMEVYGVPMHRDLVLRFIEVQALLITPICPHIAEKMWKMLGKEGFVVHAKWPQGGPVDRVLLAQDRDLEDIIYEFRNKVNVYKKTTTKNKSAKVTEATIYVSKEVPKWRESAVAYLQSVYTNNSLPPVEEMTNFFKQDDYLVKFMPQIIVLINDVQKNIGAMGSEAISADMLYDEQEFLESQLPYISATLGVSAINVVLDTAKQSKATATKPVIVCLKHIIPEKKK